MSGNKKKWILHENVRIRPLLLHLCNLFLMYDAQSAMSLHNGVMFGIQIMDSKLVDAFECMGLVKRHSAYKSRTINYKQNILIFCLFFLLPPLFFMTWEEQSQAKLQFISFIATVSLLLVLGTPKEKLLVPFWKIATQVMISVAQPFVFPLNKESDRSGAPWCMAVWWRSTRPSA